MYSLRGLMITGWIFIILCFFNEVLFYRALIAGTTNTWVVLFNWTFDFVLKWSAKLMITNTIDKYFAQCMFKDSEIIQLIIFRYFFPLALPYYINWLFSPAYKPLRQLCHWHNHNTRIVWNLHLPIPLHDLSSKGTAH